jgi:hypothetical protein
MRGDAGGAKFANRAIKVLGMTVRKRQDRAFAAECIGNGAADTACPRPSRTHACLSDHWACFPNVSSARTVQSGSPMHHFRARNCVTERG